MKRSKHSLSHYKLTTFDMGELVPVGLVEVLPGDSIQQATSALVRVSPMVAPVMHPMHVRIHHWFVPTRLVWEDFESFITGGPTGADASVLPLITLTPGEGSLGDYLGLPTGTSIAVSAIPFRCYAKVYNEGYRDQDLNTALTIDETSGPDTTTNTALQYVCWEKDFFTTARPWTQKGTAIEIPIIGDGSPPTLRTETGTAPTGLRWFSTDSQIYSSTGAGADVTGNLEWVDPHLSMTVNDLRQSMGLQRFAEMRARFGSRYVEYLRSLGVSGRDARLDRPEYLGGGRQTIQVSEVLQTGTNFDANTGVGAMKGHGIGAMRSNRYRRFFDEHGYILTLMSVMPKTMYAQGIPKHWQRTVNEEFYQRELEHIGQVEVYNREIYAPHSAPNGIFGYQDRYDEYRRMESGIAGEFRSTLNYWHAARIFTGDPALNSTFVTANPSKRHLASTNTDGLYVMVNHSIQARRVVSASGGPR